MSNTVVIPFRVDEKLEKRIKEYCEKNDMKVSEFIRGIVMEYFLFDILNEEVWSND